MRFRLDLIIPACITGRPFPCRFMDSIRKARHPDAIPRLVFADSHDQVKDFPDLKMAARSGLWTGMPAAEDLIALPLGSDLFVLPDRLPVGVDPATGKPVVVEEDPCQAGGEIRAVAAFMAPAHTALYTAAYKTKQDAAPLPLFAYTAVGWHKGRFWVPAFRSDPDPRQDANRFDLQTIRARTARQLKTAPGNRLIQHLGNCCLTYGCPAARNYFMGRWEAPLPSSPICNAACIGCISLQPPGNCRATQDRITFVPTPAEIAEIAIPHLKRAARPVVSFGQGCEGEPLLQVKTLEKAISRIRSHTGKGTINLNSNASLPAYVDRLAMTGLDSMRVSLNSARPEFHARYYRPKGFDLHDVLDSIGVMKKHNRFVSLNYFILPGFTDDPEEFAALCELLAAYRPDLIQLRNLNMDQDWYFQTLRHQPDRPPLGIRIWHKRLTELFPGLRFGYYNPPLR